MPPVRICWAWASPAYGLMLVNLLVLWLAVSVKLHPRWLVPRGSSMRVSRLSSNPALLMLPMFVVTAEDRLPAGAGILKIRRLVFLPYQSRDPLTRLPKRLKSWSASPPTGCWDPRRLGGGY